MDRISVLVVDDSVVVRRLVTDVLGADPGIEVVGAAANGKIALAKIPQLNPDLVTLDIEMPEMDGLETLRRLRAAYPALPVIMFSTLTERGATATLDALELGASDYVTKPANVGSVQASMDSVRTQLVPKIKSLCAPVLRGASPDAGRTPPARTGGALPGAAAPAATASAGARVAAPFRLRAPRPGPPEVLAIGVSTGGPDALAAVLPALPGDFPLPVLVVQHMPPVFTRLLAERLDAKCRLTVSEAQQGDKVVPGRVLLAPGDFHLRLRRRGGEVTAGLDRGTPENFCRPAVDVLFRSVVDTYGGRCLAVVLTGMGSDGARGADRIVEAGGEVLAQDRATSVVWGMPGAVAEAGLAAALLPLREIAPAVLTRLPRVPGALSGALR